MESSYLHRVARTQPSCLYLDHIHSLTVQKVVDLFLNLVCSCAGPSGKIHVLHNNSKGHVTFTSASARLLSSIFMTRPELKLMTSAIQSHLSQNHDCGLFMACVCLNTVQLSVSTGTLFLNHRSLLEKFVSIVVNYLKSADCLISVKADFSDVHVLLAYVRSVLKSKRLLNLTDSESVKLSKLVVETFVRSIPEPNFSRNIRHSDGVYILDVESTDVGESKLLHGILLDCPELLAVGGATDLTTKIKSVDCVSSEVYGVIPRVKVALFTCSMSGDVEEVVDAVFEVTKQQSDLLECSVLDAMLGLCDSLERCNVGLLLCQKVIHPKLKAVLKSKSILFVDRLGLQKILYLRDVTGAQPLASVLATSDLVDHLGWVDSVSHVVMGNRSYLHVVSSSACVVTLVVCAQWEERLAELKCCVKTSLRGLYSLSNEPRLLPGGGCWQVHCSYMLRDKILMHLTELAEEIGCTETQILLLLALFRSSFHRWVRSLARNTEHVLVDLYSSHCWRVPRGRETTSHCSDTVPCCCGLKLAPMNSLQDFDILPEYEHVSTLLANNVNTKASLVTENTHLTSAVLDNFSAAVQALERGILAANLILSIGTFINDNN